MFRTVLTIIAILLAFGFVGHFDYEYESSQPEIHIPWNYGETL